ncbi:hypothetical protein C8R46DRAFT_1124364 [Mycena filopes]|nr:hypothetical protein C8R46DRAFT_1124364 [Mycena filopes]
MSEIMVQVRWETRTASAVLTPPSPLNTGLLENPTVVDQVRIRDKTCRLTGVGRRKRGPQVSQPQRRGMVSKLQVVHGLPFHMGQQSFVEALTGIQCTEWVSDSVENAFLAQPPAHDLFGSYMIYLEPTAGGELFIRARTGAGAPGDALAMFANDQLRQCSLPGEFIDLPIRPRADTSIPDIDPKYFVLHKFVGDIVRMCGGTDLGSDDEEDDEDDDRVVSVTNIDALFEKLQSPEMDLVPREQEMIFGSRMVLIPKDMVWE